MTCRTKTWLIVRHLVKGAATKRKFCSFAEAKHAAKREATRKGTLAVEIRHGSFHHGEYDRHGVWWAW